MPPTGAVFVVQQMASPTSTGSIAGVKSGTTTLRPSFADNLSITHGDHSFKFGVYFERLKNGEAPGGQWSGVFNFAGNDNNYTIALGNTGYAYANALIGNFRNYQESTARPFHESSFDPGAVVCGGSVEAEPALDCQLWCALWLPFAV